MLSPLSSSFVKKSAPIVALYWSENWFFEYLFNKLVFPTLKYKNILLLNLNISYPASPRIITFNRYFLWDIFVMFYFFIINNNSMNSIKL